MKKIDENKILNIIKAMKSIIKDVDITYLIDEDGNKFISVSKNDGGYELEEIFDELGLDFMISDLKIDSVTAIRIKEKISKILNE